MKLSASLAFAVVLVAAPALLGQTNSTDEKVLFESLTVGKNVVKNVRVVDATPTYVTIFYDGGGMRLKRQALPPELKALYPYDEKVAAEYEQQQAAEKEKRAANERARQEQFNRELKASLMQQRAAAQQHIEQFQKELKQLEKEMVPMRAKAHGKPRSPARAEFDAAQDKKQALIHRIGEQQQLLETINKQLERLP